MNVDPKDYIYPPRAQDAVPRDKTHIYAELGWMAQLKYNDSRTLIKMVPDSIQLWSRHGDRLKYDPPGMLLDQLHGLEAALGPGHHFLDGGLLHNKHAAIKNTLVIWDILVLNGEHLLGTTYKERYGKLYTLTKDEPWVFPILETEFGRQISPDIFVPLCFAAGDWDGLWGTVTDVNAHYPTPLLEGLVFKDMTGKLQPGWSEKNNHAWMSRSRVQTKRHRH